MLKFLQRFQRGEIPFTTAMPVATTWTEFEPDEDDGSADGDDMIHHPRMEPMIPAGKRLAHLAESNGEKENSDG